MTPANTLSVACHPGDVSGLAEFQQESLGLFCWADERPMAGSAAALDWRLCGAISKLVVQGDFDALRGEVVLMPLRQSRLHLKRLFIFGLGNLTECDAGSILETCQHAIDVMRDAGAKQIWLAVPTPMQRQTMVDVFTRVVQRDLKGQVDGLLMGPMSN